jgi:hypothetical protein
MIRLGDTLNQFDTPTTLGPPKRVRDAQNKPKEDPNSEANWITPDPAKPHIQRNKVTGHMRNTMPVPPPAPYVPPKVYSDEDCGSPFSLQIGYVKPAYEDITVKLGDYLDRYKSADTAGPTISGLALLQQAADKHAQALKEQWYEANRVLFKKWGGNEWLSLNCDPADPLRDDAADAPKYAAIAPEKLVFRRPAWTRYK